MNDHRARASDADLRRIASWNATRHHQPREHCVPALVAMRAAETPDALAVASGHEALTFGALHARATALARTLRALGAGRESVVAVLLPRSASLAVAALGALYAGAAYLPIDASYPPERIRLILEDAAPVVVLTDSETFPRLPSGPWRPLDVAREAEGAVATGDPVAVGADDLAYVIYTSGSTGRPKGVEITHGSLLNLVFWHCRAFDVTPRDRASQYASPGFDAAVWELWPYLTAGASVHVVDEDVRRDPERLRDWLVERAITIGFVPTPVAERLLVLPWPAAAPLRTLLTGGDTLHVYPQPGLPFTLVNNYGPTEAAVVATSATVPWGDATDGLPPIGRPIDNTEIHILGEDRMPLAIGDAGELHIAGAGLARGYRNRPDLTAEAFVAHPADAGKRLYRTGDLARFLPDGRIAFLGRIDEQVKVRGVRIEPDEVVAALDALPGVAASAVGTRDDEAGGRLLVAWLVPAAGADLVPSSLRATLGTRLPDPMIPSLFVLVDALPLTPNGKVDRAALPKPDAANTLRDEAVAPRSAVEARLGAILGELLGAEPVGARDNFFLVGGHSLLGTQLVVRIRDAFDVELPLRTVFEHPTVEALGAEVERAILARVEAGDEAAVGRAA